MSSTFFMPPVNIIGENALADAVATLQGYGFKKGLIVTDKFLATSGMADEVIKLLNNVDIEAVVFDGTNPNPTTKNVADGLAILKENECDFVISLGGGSPHDCAKGIALCATNGDDISAFEGLDKTKNPQLPMVAINTTAGTASEMTRFCIITDEERHVKMAIVDKNSTPILSVNDPHMMKGMPKGLTAATGMDAMTHAVEAYISTAANPITDACALQAITLIVENLQAAVANGDDIKARDNMAYAQFLAGMAFNNASLGYVHAMAHQLGGMYDLPHGVCNAVLLPHVLDFNKSAAAARLKDVAKAMHIDVANMSDQEAADAAIAKIREISASIDIPANLTLLNAKEEDIPLLAKNALLDVCSVTNPVQGTQNDVENIFKAAM
ncbi:L-threonine dehydrogenase [Ignatzschineria cameli]|uniref:L-threonine dehydrogenase n=1 Tax=Ignatzschineria cameli TaxID=2182793 RepID=A0A2U2ARJ1_9GAMM|nr:L-threonine dehydrogenase [Ignatzschineria cameli]PWD83556.1 L-threonine dehydrogenase [Ignatzschineria cameli]PWD86881.1 L-threonine dehydrogenase [Ignatzschineria cameli]PWD91854.1 L-threonine dehydrogenase [Ignatzschineria cameli]PWD93559.1 L-threonine dehydrogenase [Ignatzschineria cameli]PWD94301.1 L-threonine dehydrogenase [Ignatzschineria cameli]